MHNTSLSIQPRDHGDDKTNKRNCKFCENNWVRRIAGVKRIDKQRMEELREEVGERVSQGSW